MQRVHHKISHGSIKLMFVLFLTVSFLLSGCGDSSQSSDQANAAQSLNGQMSASNARHYRITEKAIADPKTDFEQTPENQGKTTSLIWRILLLRIPSLQMHR